MLQIEKHYHGPLAATQRLTLPFESRQKSRMRCMLDSGEEVGLFLERGTVLRGGDLLEAADGRRNPCPSSQPPTPCSWRAPPIIWETATWPCR
jgi:hypothetical protein